MFLDKKLTQDQVNNMIDPLKLDLMAYYKLLEETVFRELNNALKDGLKPEEAITKIENLFEEANKMESIKKAKVVDGYESPEPGDLPKDLADLLAKVYADYRKKGMSKDEAAQRAWGAVNRQRKKSSLLQEAKKTLNKYLNIKIEKALPPGTVRQRSDGKYKKMPDGSWKRVTEGKEKGEKPTGEKKPPKWIDQDESLHHYNNFLDEAKDDLNITDEDLEYDDGSLWDNMVNLANKKHKKWRRDNNIKVKNR